MKREQLLLVITSLILVFQFFSRLLSPAQEPASGGVSMMGLVFDCVMLFSLVGISFKILKSTARPNGAVGPWMVLPVIGLLAGLGLFVLRLSGGAEEELPSRTRQSDSKASVMPPDLERLGTRAGEVIGSYQAAEAEVAKSRWETTPAAERRKLPREALQEHIARHRTWLEATDRLVDLLSEPGFEANAERLLKIYEARGIDVGMRPGQRLDLNPDEWRLVRRNVAAAYKINVLIEANWEEWLTTTLPSTGEQKPWLKEVSALESEIKTATRDMDALVAKRTASTNAPPVSPTPDQEGAKFAARLKILHATCQNLEDKLRATRWAHTVREDPEEGYRFYPYATVPLSAIPKLRKLEREDLSAFRKAQRELLGSIDQALGLFQEAEAKGIDLFATGGTPKPAWSAVEGRGPEQERWRAAQRVYALAAEQSALIEQNWEDWRRRGPEPKGNPQPWQNKAVRLRRDFVVAFNAMQDL